MRLRRLTARGFRNLADLELEIPPQGLVILGANAQGKTNLLEAIYYPVLFRSFRGASDRQVVREPQGFSVEVHLEGGPVDRVAAIYTGGRKRMTVAGAEVGRVTDAAGNWLAVAFLPTDVGLGAGPAAERRQYLDRVLSLSDRRYFRALAAYRAALAQRNSALRQGRTDLAQAFDVPLAAAGEVLVRGRLEWLAWAAGQFQAELECLGEHGPAGLQYRGNTELADPSAWPDVLRAALPSDRARAATTVGPHRDDVVLEVAGRRLREYGSTGQQRCAAVALKLIEITTLRRARNTEPVLLLDDVFAELDRERQHRLAVRLVESSERQVFVTSPRRDELPASLELPVWMVERGRVGKWESGDTSHEPRVTSYEAHPSGLRLGYD